MKVNPAPLHLAQTIITGLVIVFSICILGTAAHTLDVYNKQHASNPWWAPLWSQHFDTHGTKALIASAVVTLVLSGVFLVMSVVPKFALRQKYTLRALISLGTILPSFLLTLMTVVWAHILNRNAPELDTIQTWSCRYANSAPGPQTSSVPSHLSNESFKSVCQESRFALYGTLVVFLLLGVSMVVTMVTWLADKWAARQARKEGVETISMTTKA
ncbi:hypothetical protein HBH70_152760 [Parastagonospora nodorum]|nr:hypothetical protein HBH53_165970 [Parastagonospora nodorum]KAH3965492.1 hypothetical protein HBH51_152060 [Parastagonospora nodorum]KAH3977511.1 hypothetical protein HBH52_112390 [Parastagonospora nodorum]KAH4103181.1 hypothetical protein HBH46_115190 [Parastagonospora nodorum]KAH4178520.1 hypothetical protein HBH43_025160 [Parastagonospora nodorum]